MEKKTPPEHNIIVDIFDEIITFSYAYEWQKSRNNSIDNLLELRDFISSFIGNSSEHYYKYLSSDPDEKLRSIACILDKLNQAVLDDDCPKLADINEDWLNTEDLKLIKKQEEESDLVTMLVTNVVSSLNHSLPDEIQPFVTNEQVNAIFLKLWAEMPDRITVPIYKTLLVSLIHQYFLKTVSIKKNTHKYEISLNELVDGYFEKAKHQLIKTAKENLLTEIAIKFFPIAQCVGLEIDQYYPWGMICYLAIDYQTELLPWYACLNRSGLIEDSQYIGDKTQNKEITDLKLLRLLTRKINYAMHPSAPKSNFKKYIFDSNRTSILIDGNTLQNHLVMAFPYDKPLPDLQEKLRDYAIHIGNWVYDYGRQFGHPPGYGDEENSAIACRNMAPLYKRITLSNAGSILQNICRLIFLKLARSEKSIQSQEIDTFKLIDEHKFKYSMYAIEKARKNAIKDIKDNKLFPPHFKSRYSARTDNL